MKGRSRAQEVRWWFTGRFEGKQVWMERMGSRPYEFVLYLIQGLLYGVGVCRLFKLLVWHQEFTEGEARWF